MNPFGKHLWKFARKGSFSKKVNFCVNIVNDFRVPTSGRDICKINRAYKSLKVMTGWHAYRMLAFHLYHLNQLEAIPLACRAHTRSVLSNARSRVMYIGLLKKFNSWTLKNNSRTGLEMNAYWVTINKKLSFAFMKPGQNSYNDDICRICLLYRKRLSCRPILEAPS